ncbi:type VI secretion system-associated FHA domain protein TagH [Steroidobacter agaridevorans]|uniref:type VI secretion system-associated FHA domain protein TagH n=1 Tax=Steroidobacter agaridevorans TaxID=2695856 RepID=UPI001322DB88|nr:type VI secretion system-associated FHA domain protein TagH [Steroidobacter agaridevorans]GFE91317.1 phosphopeptide-binding protein [Steroidobacter agaridevorans]
MILTLEVTGPQAQAMGAAGRKIFKALGGTIGRLPDNDWVFPDPYVSGRHALIRYVNGKYFVEDTSTNGVFINSPDNRLTRGQPQQLRNGDLLYIDAYQINVSIAKDATEDLHNDPFAPLKNGGPKLVPPARRAATPAPAVAEDRTESLVANRQSDNRNATILQDSTARVDEDDEDEEEEADEDHATEWFGMAEVAEPKKPAPAAVPSRSRPEVVKSTVAIPTPPRPQPQPQPQRPAPATKAIPKAVTKEIPSAPAPRPRPEQSKPVTGDGAQLTVLFDAAGIEGLEPSTENARMLGEILRIALGGVMETLRTRERVKDELRMRGTSFKAADNNPLKFSANVDDAFHNLLVKHNPAYLAPPDAFEDAFRDVRDHQSAFLAAMRLAFESMLSQFDPQRMQDEFDRQMKGSILGVPAKLRYWDLYRDKYGELSKDAETGFRTLFGDAFARAYEEHLERLKKSSRPVGQ